MPKRYTKRQILSMLSAADLPKLQAPGGDFNAKVEDEFGHAIAMVYGGKERFARAEFFAAAPAIIRQLLRKGTKRTKGKVA